MLLKNKVRTEQIKAFEWALFPGVEFQLAFQSRKKSSENIKNGYVTIVEDGKTRQEFDAEKFSKHYVASTVMGWKGLKLKHLHDWMLMEEGYDPEEEVTFCPENALFLYENWKPFEDWITTVVHSVERFREGEASGVAGATEAVPVVAE